MGCEVIADGFECFPGAPLTWTMWRQPGAGLCAQQTMSGYGAGGTSGKREDGGGLLIR